MAAATKDIATPRRSVPEALYDEYPLAADTTIFAGTMVEVVNGFAQPAGTAGGATTPVFFATEHVSNAGGNAGDVFIKLEYRGVYLFKVDGGGLTRADIGTTSMYALDDQTLTKTAGADPANAAVGKIQHWESATEAWVLLKGPYNSL